MLTRKHFQAIAHAVRLVQDFPLTIEENESRGKEWATRQIAENLAAALKRENPSFDRQRFLVACGFPDA